MPPFLQLLGFLLYGAVCYALSAPIQALPLSFGNELTIVIASIVFGFFIIVVDTEEETPGWKYPIIAGKMIFFPLSIVACAIIAQIIPIALVKGIVLSLLYVAFAWRVLSRTGNILKMVKRLTGTSE